MGEAYPVQRRFSRIPSDCPVLVRKLGGGGLGNFARTKDISPGGLGIVFREGLGNGAHLQLLLSVKGHLIEAEGRVRYEIPVHAAETQIGVEFVQISPVDREVIESLVNAHVAHLSSTLKERRIH